MSLTTRNLSAAIAGARGRLLASGREGLWAYVVEENDEWSDGGFEILGEAGYQESGREDRCQAVLWTYRDPAGVLRVAEEAQADW